MNSIPFSYIKFVLLLCGIVIRADTQAQVYKIGDTIAKIKIDQQVNWSGDTYLPLKDKALILDFWATWCSPCIALFPKIDSLQRVFADDFTIMGVTSDKNTAVTNFLQNYKKNFGITLASITDDKELKTLFPHYQIPHYVWINKDGVVSAITTAEYVNEDNIRKLIAGEILSLPTKNEHQDVNTYKVLNTLAHIDERRGYPSLISYSYIGNYQEDVKSFSTAPIYDKKANVTRIRAINSSLSALYKLAFLNLEGVGFFHNGRVIYENMTEPVADHATKQNLFSFDQITLGSGEAKALDKMKKTLDAEFGILSKIEDRMVECIVLNRGKNLQVASQDSKSQTIETRDSVIKNNVSIKNLLGMWNGYNPLLSLPIVNEIGLDDAQKISITLPKNVEDFGSIISSLENAGIIPTKEYREMPVIVLTRN